MSPQKIENWKLRSLKGALLWTVLLLYLIVPVTLVLLFREPEITGLVQQIPHGVSVVKAIPVVWLVLTIKYGVRGLVFGMALTTAAFRYEVDYRLLYEPPASLSLAGQTAVVTGANSGIGLAIATALSKMGAQVVLTCRSAEKCQPAVDQAIRAGRTSGGSASFAVFHLDSLASAQEVSRHIVARHPRIHFLFNNAGTTPRHQLTEEGLEDGFGGMHLAHMALTLGLLPSLRAAGEADDTPARVVMTSSDIGVTSACGFFGSEPFDESFMKGNGEGDLRGELLRGNGLTGPSIGAYGRAKLCNILFAFELTRRLHSNKISVIAHAVHTGAVATTTACEGVGGIFAHLPIPGLAYVTTNIWTPLLWRSADAGAKTLLFAALATEPVCMASGGQYVSALCRPYLDEDTEGDELVKVELWGNRTLHVHRTRRQGLQHADRKWSTRLWEVSINLLTKGATRDLVELAEQSLALSRDTGTMINVL